MVTDDTIIVTYPHIFDSDTHVGTTIGALANAAVNSKKIVLSPFGAKVIVVDKSQSIPQFVHVGGNRRKSFPYLLSKLWQFHNPQNILR